MKRVIKNNIKVIIAFIVGIAIATTVGVSATILYQASEIGFTPNNPNWHVNNLEGALNELYAAKNEQSISGSSNYVDSEQVIGTWIDGKPLYQLTQTLNSFGNTSLPTGVTSHDVRKLDAVYYQNDGSAVQLGYYYSSSNLFNMWLNSSNEIVWVTSGRSAGFIIYTIQYTKTTDNSINNTD